MIKDFYIVQINNGKKSPALYTIPDVTTWIEENWKGNARLKISVNQRNLAGQMEALEREEKNTIDRLEHIKKEMESIRVLQNGSGPKS